MKVKCTYANGEHLTVGKIYEMEDGCILNDNSGEECVVFASKFEEYKQTPYQYLIEYYGLEEGKKYHDNRTSHCWHISSGYITTDSNCDFFIQTRPSTATKAIHGLLIFTEVPQKKTVTLELTDEQLEQIKKIIE